MSGPREITRYTPGRVGRLIRHMRTSGGLSQTDLGRKLGFDRSSIAHMESGTHAVSLADLMKIADECGFVLQLTATRRVK